VRPAGIARRRTVGRLRTVAYAAAAGERRDGPATSAGESDARDPYHEDEAGTRHAGHVC